MHENYYIDSNNKGDPRATWVSIILLYFRCARETATASTRQRVEDRRKKNGEIDARQC